MIKMIVTDGRFARWPDWLILATGLVQKNLCFDRISTKAKQNRAKIRVYVLRIHQRIRGKIRAEIATTSDSLYFPEVKVAFLFYFFF